jgi:prevent-host-death family protein
MEQLGVLEARQRLPELLRRVSSGEETLITRHGKPVAALVPLHQRLRPLRQSLTSLRGTGSRCWPQRGTPETTHRQGGRPKLDLLRLPHGALLALDASVIIPFLRGETVLGAAYAPLLEGIAMGRWRGVLSMATLGSLVGGALAAGRDDLAERWERVFSDPSGWILVNTTPQVIIAAARLQHRSALAAGPALELASALQGGATAMISHDPESLLCGDPPLLPVLSALMPVL